MIATYHRLQKQRAAGEIEGGFTLIELLIVIVVLGILAAIVVFALGSVTGQSAKAACAADGATLTTAMAAYNAQNGSNPTNNAAIIGNGVQSMPNNLTHYSFGIVAGVLYVEVPGTQAWQTTPANGGALASGIAYAGVGSCSTVS